MKLNGLNLFIFLIANSIFFKAKQAKDFIKPKYTRISEIFIFIVPEIKYEIKREFKFFS